MNWSPDDILDSNAAQPNQSRSRLERVVALGQANLEILSEVADELEARPTNHVAGFFQLPYPVRIEAGWHRVKTAEQGLYAELKCEPCRISITGAESFELVRASASGHQKSPSVTQVVALIPVWGRRALYHDKYLNHVAEGRRGNPIIIPQGQSWVQNRPMFLDGYEQGLGTRIIREIMAAMRDFLPAYSVLAVQEAPVPSLLYSYFAMTAPGRLIFAGNNVSVIEPLLQSRSWHASDAPVGAAALTSAMKTRYRDLGQFEAQLFALERLRSQGELALALVGTLSLLEWLLTTFIIRHGGKKPKNLADAIKHPFVTFFSTEELEMLYRVRHIRNQAVHEKLPARESLVSAGNLYGRELTGMSAAISPDEVRVLMQIVFEAFRAVNRALSKDASNRTGLGDGGG